MISLASSRATVVTPFVGVWIEIRDGYSRDMEDYVTPFVGVWIEITERRYKPKSKKSLPSWECGLKSDSPLIL